MFSLYFIDWLIDWFNVYLFLFERDRAWAGEGQRQERDSQAGSAWSTQSLTQDSNSQTVRSWPEPKWRVRRLTDCTTQAPPIVFKWIDTYLQTFLVLTSHMVNIKSSLESSIICRSIKSRHQKFENCCCTAWNLEEKPKEQMVQLHHFPGESIH